MIKKNIPFSTTLGDPVISVLEELKSERFELFSLTSDEFWNSWEILVSDNSRENIDFANKIKGQNITLSFLGRSHIGDVLCLSRLVRRLTQEFGCCVKMVRHRSTYKVFENNPHLFGFNNDNRFHINESVRGSGHIIQKIERYFGLEIDPFPRPEIYLSSDELYWAWQVRRKLPRNKPVALVCTNSVTDSLRVGTHNLEWQQLVNIVSKHFTVIQLALTDISKLEEVIRMTDRHKAAWKPDNILDNCFIYENLDARHFFSIFSIADMYLGPNSGGAHLAAAFEIPALVVLNSRQYKTWPVFPDQIEENHWRDESFLYPYHNFIMV